MNGCFRALVACLYNLAKRQTFRARWFKFLRGHIVKKQIYDLLDHIVLGHWRGLVCLTMLISESDFTVRGSFVLPGEGGHAPGAHEARRRNFSLAGVIGIATHDLVVELVPDAGSIKTIYLALFNVFKGHIGDCAGKISKPGCTHLGWREKGRVTNSQSKEYSRHKMNKRCSRPSGIDTPDSSKLEPWI